MSLRYRVSAGPGFTVVVDAQEAGLEFLRFGLLRLGAAGIWKGATSADEEASLVILSGRCSVKAGDQHWPGLERDGVFSGRAAGVYIPPGCDFQIEATSALEAALCFSLGASAGGEPQVVMPADVQVRTVGDQTWRREVHDIIGQKVPAQRLLVGETYNEPGKWSSYPPHKHDVEEPPDEVKQEEIYHFRLNPPQGFGFQRIYTADGSMDKAYTIVNGDTIVIPRGYHPVAAAPGYSLYYLWMIAGRQRIMRPRDDPAHTWVKSLEGKKP